MILSDGFHWLHANGEWVQYFEVESLANRLGIEYALVWKYVQNGMRSDEQLPKLLPAKKAKKGTKAKTQTNEFASRKAPVIQSASLKVQLHPDNHKQLGMEEWEQEIAKDKQRYGHDWHDESLRILANLRDKD